MLNPSLALLADDDLAKVVCISSSAAGYVYHALSR